MCGMVIRVSVLAPTPPKRFEAGEFTKLMHTKDSIEKTLPFVKAHAYGNDFILVSDDDWGRLPPEFSDASRLAVLVCDRRRGLGGDGLVTYSDRAPFAMHVFNRDGSPAEISGNGLRCLAAHLVSSGKAAGNQVNVLTDSGDRTLSLMYRSGERARFNADMGTPVLTLEDVAVDSAPESGAVIGEPLQVDGESLEVTALSVGNPHCVVFVDELDRDRLLSLGPAIEAHPRFPERTNVEFVRVRSREFLEMLIWERGAGETGSSGTGSAAAAVAAMINRLVDTRVTVSCPGGMMVVEWRDRDRVWLEGDATVVAVGSVNLSSLLRE